MNDGPEEWMCGKGFDFEWSPEGKNGDELNEGING